MPLEEVPDDNDNRALETLRLLEETMTEVQDSMERIAWQSLARNIALQLAVFRDAALDAGFTDEFAEWMAKAWAETSILKPVRRVEHSSSTPHIIVGMEASLDEDEEGEPTESNE